jgi:segregation and condensation protein B
MSEVPESQPNSADDAGITLDELAAAYAQSVAGRAEPVSERDSAADDVESDERPGEPSLDERAETPEDEALATDDDAPLPEDEEADDDDPCPLSPRTILEAMLFVGSLDDEPLTAVRAAELMRGVSPEEIPPLVDKLNRRYASNGCPYRIVSEGAGYRISLHKRFHPIRSKFYGRVREARLSQAALDVLAIVAYRQPITAEEVARLRGTPSTAVLTQLVRRQLLRIERTPGKRRPLSYRTTERFLDLFGLETLDDLPQAEDLENH